MAASAPEPLVRRKSPSCFSCEMVDPIAIGTISAATTQPTTDIEFMAIPLKPDLQPPRGTCHDGNHAMPPRMTSPQRCGVHRLVDQNAGQRIVMAAVMISTTPGISNARACLMDETITGSRD